MIERHRVSLEISSHEESPAGRGKGAAVDSQACIDINTAAPAIEEAVGRDIKSKVVAGDSSRATVVDRARGLSE